MEQPKKLLLLASPEMQRTPAFVRARELAMKTGAGLHLCLIDYSPAISNLRHIDDSVMKLAADAFMKSRLEWLESEVGKLGEEKITATCSAIWGKAFDQIAMDVVLRQAPDIVIKDVEASKPLLRTLFTPQDWELLRLCPAPLMLVNAEANPHPRRVIAAVDPMEDDDNPHELNDQILDGANALALLCDAQLNAVYAYPDLDIPDRPVEGVEVTEHTKVHLKALDTHRAAFNKLMDKYSVPAEQRHFLQGKVIEEAISDFADHHDSDLIVMGAVYRDAVDRFMLGSTAERLLYKVNCDVLTLKPKGFLAKASKQLKPDEERGIVYKPK